MDDRQFRKLNIDLPKEPLSNQRPWMIAGVMIVLLFVWFVLHSYLKQEEMPRGCAPAKNAVG